jgi:hypothetical protein
MKPKHPNTRTFRKENEPECCVHRKTRVKYRSISKPHTTVVVRAESINAPHTYAGEICIKSERKSKYIGRTQSRRK